jgi:hypothetical protein
MVSNDPIYQSRPTGYDRFAPLRMNMDMFDDAAVANNTLLKQRIARLERENLMLRQIIAQMRERNK